MSYHPVVEKIKGLLRGKKLWFETFEHEPVRTSDEAAKVRAGYGLEQGAKAIVLKIKKQNGQREYVMLVLSGHLRFDSKKTKKVLGARDITFASEEDVLEITAGVQPGGVPPLGSLFGLKVVVDEGLLKNEKIVFNAGDKRYSIAMKTDDYISLINPIVQSIT